MWNLKKWGLSIISLVFQRFNFFHIWHSQDDAKVRSDHAANNGKIFSWDNPPPTVHPGEDYNCRCQAAPIQLAVLDKAAYLKFQTRCLWHWNLLKAAYLVNQLLLNILMLLMYDLSLYNQCAISY